MMMIRRATEADLPRISEIRSAVRENRLSRPDAITPEEVFWFLREPGIWVWDEGGRVLGFSAGDTRKGWIWALFVDPAYERRGIGRALFERACAVLRQTGFKTLRLSTDPGTRAERFYRRAGWRSLEMLPSGEILFESDA